MPAGVGYAARPAQQCLSQSAPPVERRVSSRRDHRGTRRSSHPNPSFPRSVGASHPRQGAGSPRGREAGWLTGPDPQLPARAPSGGDRRPAEGTVVPALLRAVPRGRGRRWGAARHSRTQHNAMAGDHSRSLGKGKRRPRQAGAGACGVGAGLCVRRVTAVTIVAVLFSLLRQRSPGAGARGGDPALQHEVLPLRPKDSSRPPRQGHQVRPSRRAGVAVLGPGGCSPPAARPPPRSPRPAAPRGGPSGLAGGDSSFPAYLGVLNGNYLNSPEKTE